MCKVGEVYSTIVEGKRHHPVVIIQPFDEMYGLRIKAVGLSHDSRLNLPFDESYIVTPDENNHYSFKWEDLGDGRKTSLMQKGFNKKIAYLDEKIGEITKEGIEYIKEHVSVFIECDTHITEYKSE